MPDGSTIKFYDIASLTEFIQEAEGKITSRFKVEYREGNWVLTFTGAY